MPLAFSRAANSSTFVSSPTDTISGRCFSICLVNSSTFAPAASATTPKRPGSDSTTDRHCPPIEPVDPNIANFVNACVTKRSRLRLVPLKKKLRSITFQASRPTSNNTRQPESPESARRYGRAPPRVPAVDRSEEHTSELQSPCNLVCRLLLEKKKTICHINAIILRYIRIYYLYTA